MLTGLRHTGGIAGDAAYTLHQIELFYYVAKHGGISAASRHMPYGIGQPAISGQMTEMERNLGARLFERKPFKLTEPGEKLFAHISPCFEKLPALWRELREDTRATLLIAAEDMLGVGFLADLQAAAMMAAPEARIDLRVRPAGKTETWLSEQGSHLAIAITDRRKRGANTRLLESATIQLLVSSQSKINSAGHFWSQGRVAEALIYPFETGAVHRTFERGLKALGVDWPVRMRVNSPAVMTELVARGKGIGLGTGMSGVIPPSGVSLIPLTGFDSVQIEARYRKSAKSQISRLLDFLSSTARVESPLG